MRLAPSISLISWLSARAHHLDGARAFARALCRQMLRSNFKANKRKWRTPNVKCELRRQTLGAASGPVRGYRAPATTTTNGTAACCSRRRSFARLRTPQPARPRRQIQSIRQPDNMRASRELRSACLCWALCLRAARLVCSFGFVGSSGACALALALAPAPQSLSLPLPLWVLRPQN